MQTIQQILTQLESLADGAGKSAEDARKRSCAEAAFVAQKEAYLRAANLVANLIPRNENPTAEDFKAVAAKFYEAGNGDGPGITHEVLGQIGLPPKPKPEFSWQETWEGMCKYVWFKFTKDPWPGSEARGRGRHSRDVARNVAQLLERIAAEKTEAA